jgi:hypothetical protein
MNKKCTKCGLLKKVSEFPKDKNCKNGVSTRCKKGVKRWD